MSEPRATPPAGELPTTTGVDVSPMGGVDELELLPALAETLEPAVPGEVSTRSDVHEGSGRVRHRRVPIPVKIALGWFAVVVFCAVFASVLPVGDPDAITDNLNQKPGLRLEEPLGTDHLGRSELARVVYGSRVTLIVSLAATACGAVIGTALGLFAGYARGTTDSLIDLFVTTLLAFPPLLLLIAFAAILEPSAPSLVFELALLGIPLFTRVCRASTLSLTEREFVVAARSMGAKRHRIIFKELLPNVSLPVSSYAVIAVGTAMVAEGSLSFLGLGIRPPTPSWGVMVAEGRQNMTTFPHEVFVPGVCFVLTVLAINTIGDWVRSRVRGGQEIQ